MKKSLWILFWVFLFSQSGQAQDKRSPNSQGRSNCETHTVINETNKTSSTITRCLNDSVTKLSDQKPKSDEDDDGNLINHGYPFNIFTDLDTQKSIAQSTVAISTYTFWGLVVGTVGLVFLGWTLMETREAAKTARNTLLETQRANILQLKPYITLDSARMEEPFKNKTGENVTAIILKFKNTGKSTAEIVGGWISREKLEITAHGNGKLFQADVIRVDPKGPRHVFVNPGESFNMMCIVTFGEIPSFVPLDKLCFDISGSVDFRDISTPENEDWARLCMFQANRLVREFSQSQKDWRNVDLITECTILGDQIAERIEVQIAKGNKEPNYGK